MGLLTVALAVAATAMSGCGGSGDPDETKIAFLLPTEPVVRFLGQPGFGEKVRELCPHCSVLYDNARGSSARQQAQAEQALSAGADVLVLDAVDPGAAARIAGEARSENVPLIAYVHPVPNSKVDYYVGVNGEGLGNLQAEAVLEKLKKEGQPNGPVVVMNVGAGSPRDATVRAALAAGGVKIAREYEIDHSGSTAEAFSLARHDMASAIGALGPGGFAAVLAPDDETAAGAITAMRSAGIDPAKRATTGAGASLAAVKRVLAGEQYVSAYEANWQVRAAAARLAVRLARGRPVPDSWITERLSSGDGEVPAILLQPTIVNAINLMSTVVPYGFTKPKQLCVGRYARYCAEAPWPIH